MARVQLLIPDGDRDRFLNQARKENMTLSAWLRAAALERLEIAERSDKFGSPADLTKFFLECEAVEGPESEPDWAEHLTTINQSRQAHRPNS